MKHPTDHMHTDVEYCIKSRLQLAFWQVIDYKRYISTLVHCKQN